MNTHNGNPLAGLWRHPLVPAVLLGSAAAAAVICLGGTAQAAPGGNVASAPGQAAGRVLVVGFDGADWRKTEELMEAGQLPNLSALRDTGAAGPLVSTNPAESAAGWAAINTGANPLKNGVPSFFRRDFTGAGLPFPNLGHVDQGTVSTAGMEKPGAAGLLERFGGGSSHIVLGLVVFFLATLIFRFLLRAHALLALLLGIALGAATALGTRTAGSNLPSEVAGVVSSRVKLDGFWVEAARAGHSSVALQAPLVQGRPGDPLARTLFGLGQPDVRGALNGEWFLYTTDLLASEAPPEGETVGNTSTGTRFRVAFEEGDAGAPRIIKTSIFGPINLIEQKALRERFDEIESFLGDPEKRREIDYKESRVLSDEKDKLNRTLSEMGAPPEGSRVSPKEYKHRLAVDFTIQEPGASEGEGAGWKVAIGGEEQTLQPGEWSELYSLGFEMGPLLTVHATTKVRITSTDPLEIYVDTLQIDPRNAPFWQPVSEPLGFAAELAAGIGGPFETLGWGCITNQVKDKKVDAATFLSEVEFTMTYRRKLLERSLEGPDWRVLYSVFSATDRVQHIMYRHYDPLHPEHDPEEAAQKVTFFGEEMTLAEAIPAIYRQMDQIVGEVVTALGPNDTLILCADHGFTSYRRGMDVNNWLESEGFLVLREDVSSTSESEYLGAVDWSKTQAYALGLGMVFLNLEGREGQGIVKVEDARPLLESIGERFLAARDGDARVGASATIMQDVYEGPEAWGTQGYPCADLMLGFAEFYRVDWRTTGADMKLSKKKVDGADRVVAGAIYRNNTNPWSGDHASNDPRLVTGIFFCNRPVEVPEDGEFSVMDIAPTVLDQLGAPAPASMDRAPLVIR